MRRFLLIALLFFIAISSSAEEKRYIIPSGDSPSFGPVNAPITIIEFLDYQ